MDSGHSYLYEQGQWQGVIAIPGHTPTKTINDAGPLLYLRAFGRRGLNPYVTRQMAEADWIDPDAQREMRLVAKVGRQSVHGWGWSHTLSSHT